jgi:hypothetical protein
MLEIVNLDPQRIISEKLHFEERHSAANYEFFPEKMGNIAILSFENGLQYFKYSGRN